MDEDGPRAREGVGPCGMAEDTFPQKRIGGDARLAARCHENAWSRSVSATSRSTWSTPSSGIWAISIPATRMSNPRYVSSFSICATADLLISCLVVIIACDPRRPAWPGFSTITPAIAVVGTGPMIGRACVTTIVPIAELGHSRRLTVTNRRYLANQMGANLSCFVRLIQLS